MCMYKSQVTLKKTNAQTQGTSVNQRTLKCIHIDQITPVSSACQALGLRYAARVRRFA